MAGVPIEEAEQPSPLREPAGGDRRGLLLAGAEGALIINVGTFGSDEQLASEGVSDA